MINFGCGVHMCVREPCIGAFANGPVEHGLLSHARKSGAECDHTQIKSAERDGNGTKIQCYYM